MDTITTAQLTITEEPEALVGLTCSSCSAPATHSTELLVGTSRESMVASKSYACQIHTVLNLPRAAEELNPNVWPEYVAMAARLGI